MASVLPADVRTQLAADLRALLGDRYSVNPTLLEHHSHGESWHAAGEPDVVVFPTSTDEVSAIVQIAGRVGAPVVPFGAGSSLEGHVNAVRGGVSIDMTRIPSWTSSGMILRCAETLGLPWTPSMRGIE